MQWLHRHKELRDDTRLHVLLLETDLSKNLAGTIRNHFFLNKNFSRLLSMNPRNLLGSKFFSFGRVLNKASALRTPVTCLRTQAQRRLSTRTAGRVNEECTYFRSMVSHSARSVEFVNGKNDGPKQQNVMSYHTRKNQETDEAFSSVLARAPLHSNPNPRFECLDEKRVALPTPSMIVCSANP